MMSAAPNSAHCCLCGAPRKPTQRPVDSFGNDIEIVQMSEHRPMLDGRWEHSPQLLVNVCMWRNGGSIRGQTHICDDCIVVGLKAAKKFVDASIEVLSTSKSAE
jgi:hypothetical protein